MSSTSSTIDRREGLAYDEFVTEYLVPAKPVLIANAFPDWRALNKWTPEFFRVGYGDREVEIGHTRWRLGDYIDHMVAANPDTPAPYLRDEVIRDIDPGLGWDLYPFVPYALPNWLRGMYPDARVHHDLNRAAEVALHLGGAGTRLGAHFDACPSLICQIYGKRTWTLVPPDDTPYLYSAGDHSAIDDLDAPDLERFPLFERAAPLRFTQEAGEAVYVPPFWWQATKLLTPSVAVASTFANAAHWDGLIKDVVQQYASGNAPLGHALHAYMKLDAAIKARRGPRLGAESHFIEPTWQRPITLAKRVYRALKNLR